jgi:hypothetical protein
VAAAHRHGPARTITLTAKGWAMARCRSCHAEVIWSETANGRRAPFDAPEGIVSHFATCPQRDEWRKQQTAALSAEAQGSLLDAAPKPTETRYPR